MTDQQTWTAVDFHPTIRKIDTSDLKDALTKGVDDFLAMPSHAIFLGLIYPVVGLVLLAFALGSSVMPLLYPIVAGFALLGPFAALGLYELSRRREQGLEVNAWHAFDVLHSPSIGAIAALGLGLTVLFVTWLAIAQAIYQANFGYGTPESFTSFIRDMFTTAAGWRVIIIGNLVGLLFAVVTLTVSVVSFPLLLDHPVGAVVAIATSARAVFANPKPMALWGVIVVVALALGSLPFLFGLAVVMPVLGHATWHLYRKVVAH